VAWSRVNPSTVGLLKEDTEDSKKENTLFGRGFLERATKRLEDEKAITKVTGNRFGTKPQQKCQQDPNDLRYFFGEAPTRYGGGKPQHRKLYY